MGVWRHLQRTLEDRRRPKNVCLRRFFGPITQQNLTKSKAFSFPSFYCCSSAIYFCWVLLLMESSKKTKFLRKIFATEQNNE
jgi:hypothetical protein